MRYCELGVGWVGGWVGGEVPVLCGCKGAGLEEGQGHIVYVVEGETVQTVEHGGERAQEVLNVVACLGGWVGGWVGGWFVSSSTQPPIQDIQQCVRTAFFSSMHPKQNKPPASQPPTHPPTTVSSWVGTPLAPILLFPWNVLILWAARGSRLLVLLLLFSSGLETGGKSNSHCFLVGRWVGGWVGGLTTLIIRTVCFSPTHPPTHPPTCPKSPILTMKEERMPFLKRSLGSSRSLIMMLSYL